NEDPLHRAVGEDFVVAHDPLITSLRQHLWGAEQQPCRLRSARQRRAGEDEFVAEGGGGRGARAKGYRRRVWRDVVGQRDGAASERIAIDRVPGPVVGRRQHGGAGGARGERAALVVRARGAVVGQRQVVDVQPVG